MNAHFLAKNVNLLHNAGFRMPFILAKKLHTDIQFKSTSSGLQKATAQKTLPTLKPNQFKTKRTDKVSSDKYKMSDTKMLVFMSSWADIINEYTSKNFSLRFLYADTERFAKSLKASHLDIKKLNEDYILLFSKINMSWKQSTTHFLKIVYFRSIYNVISRNKFVDIGNFAVKIAEHNRRIPFIISTEYQDAIKRIAFNYNQPVQNFADVLAGFVRFIETSDQLFKPNEDEAWKIIFLEAAKLNNNHLAVEFFLKQMVLKEYTISTCSLAIEVLNTLGLYNIQMDKNIADKCFCLVLHSSLTSNFVDSSLYLDALSEFFQNIGNVEHAEFVTSIFYRQKDSCRDPILSLQLEKSFHKTVSLIILKSFESQNPLYEHFLFLFESEIDDKLGSYITRTLTQHKKYLQSRMSSWSKSDTLQATPQMPSLKSIKSILYCLVNGHLLSRYLVVKLTNQLLSFISLAKVAIMINSKSKFIHRTNMKAINEHLGLRLHRSAKFGERVKLLLDYNIEETHLLDLRNSLKWDIKARSQKLTGYDKIYSNIGTSICRFISISSKSSYVSRDFFAIFVNHMSQTSPEKVASSVHNHFRSLLSSSPTASSTEIIKTLLLYMNVLKKTTDIPNNTTDSILYFDIILSRLGNKKKMQNLLGIDTKQMKSSPFLLCNYFSSQSSPQRSFLYEHLTLINFITLCRRSQITLDMENVNVSTEKDVVRNLSGYLNRYNHLSQPEIVIKLLESIMNFSNIEKTRIIYPFIFAEMATVLIDCVSHDKRTGLSKIFILMDQLLRYSKKLSTKARKHCRKEDIWFYKYSLNNNALTSFCEAAIHKSNLYQAVYLALFWLPRSLDYKLPTKIYAMLLNKAHKYGENAGSIDDRLVFFIVDHYTHKYKNRFQSLFENNTFLYADTARYLLNLRGLNPNHLRQ